jgi:hypothetical protein
MENDMLQQRKDPFPKAVVDACRILAEWKNAYISKDNRLNEVNDSCGVHGSGVEKRRTVEKKRLNTLSSRKWDIITMNLTRKKLKISIRKYLFWYLKKALMIVALKI